MNIRRHRLITAISKKTGIERPVVKIMIDAFTAQIISHLMKGNTVYMSGFGVFSTKERAARKWPRASRRGSIFVPAHKFPHMKFSKILREQVKAATLVQPPKPEQ